MVTLKTSNYSTCIGASEFKVLQAIQQVYLFCDWGVSKTRGRSWGRSRGRSLSFFKECCFMVRVRVRVRHGFRFRPDAGRNVRLFDM